MKLLLRKDNHGMTDLTKEFYLKVLEIEKNKNIREESSIYKKYNLQEYTDIWIDKIRDDLPFSNYISKYMAKEEIEHILNKIKKDIVKFLEYIDISKYGSFNLHQFEYDNNGKFIPIATFENEAERFNSPVLIKAFDECGEILFYPFYCFGDNENKYFYYFKKNPNSIKVRSNEIIIETYNYFKNIGKPIICYRGTDIRFDDLNRFFVYKDDYIYNDEDHRIEINSSFNNKIEYAEALSSAVKKTS